MAKRGQRGWVPKKGDIEKAEILAGQGLTGEEIAYSLGIGKTTLYKNAFESSELANAIKRGKLKAKRLVVGKLFEAIQNNNLTAIIFYLKTQGGWSERVQLETGEKPLQLEGVITLKQIQEAYKNAHSDKEATE